MATKQAQEIDLAQLFPQGRMLTIGEKEIPISPLTISQLGQITRLLQPALAGRKLTDAMELDLLDLMANHTDAMIEVCAVATGMPKEWVAGLLADDFLTLASAVASINIDFFVRRVGPKLHDAMTQIGKALGDGPTPATS